MRGRLQRVRGEVHAEAAAVGQAVDELPGVQEAGAEDYFVVQFAAEAEAAVGDGREEGGFHGAEASEQGGIRAAINGRKTSGVPQCPAMRP